MPMLTSEGVAAQSSEPRAHVCNACHCCDVNFDVPVAPFEQSGVFFDFPY